MNAIGAVIITILTSLFFFPFNSSLLPSVNTKLAMSLFGLLLFAYHGFRSNDARLDRTLSVISIFAVIVSLVGLTSLVINNTSDYTYTTYIVSVWVWISGAYVVIKAIDWFYGRATLRIVANFLIAVCVIQCILSQLTDHYGGIAAWVKSFVVSEGFMGIPKGRLYGIGCALDVAGLKFCTVLILISYFAVHPSGKINRYLESALYAVSFIIISVFGSMIARTTSVGICAAVLLWCVYPLIYRHNNKPESSCFLKTLLLCLAVMLPLAWYEYRTNQGFYHNLRFGFEGFFALAEKGEWVVRSNEQLQGMWVWPDNLKTWLIGDGYFNSPSSNPFYVGPNFEDFYMGTDIGYCRFIFYFGIIGLIALSSFFISCAVECSENNPKCTLVFWAILAINFIGWVKVSSDIFPVFALILLLDANSKTNEPGKTSALLGSSL